MSAPEPPTALPAPESASAAVNREGPDRVPPGRGGIARAHMGLVALVVAGAAASLSLKVGLAAAHARVIPDAWLAYATPSTIESAMNGAGATACTAIMGLLLLDGWSRRFRRSRRPGLHPLVVVGVALLAVGFVGKLAAVASGAVLVYSAAQVADLAAIALFVVGLGENSRPVHVADSPAAPWFVLAVAGVVLLKGLAVSQPELAVAPWLWIVLAAFPAAFGAVWFVWTADGPPASMVARNLNLLGVALVMMVLPWLVARLVPWRGINTFVAEFHLVAITYAVVGVPMALRAARGLFGAAPRDRAIAAALSFGLLLIAKASLPDPLAPWIGSAGSGHWRVEFLYDQAVVGVFLVGAAATLALLRRRGADRASDGLLLAAFTASLTSLLALRVVGAYRASYLLHVEGQLTSAGGSALLVAEFAMAVAWALALLVWTPVALRLLRLHPILHDDDVSEPAHAADAASLRTQSL